MRRSSRKRKADSEKGIAVIEFAIAMPFLAIMMLSALDLGQVLIQYIQMSAAVREGVRVASSTTDIDSTESYSQLTAGQNCDTPDLTGPDAARHVKIQERVMQVMGQRSLLIEANKICVESGVNAEVSGEKNIYVKLNTEYRGFFPILNGMQIEVEALAPYLS